MRMTLALLILLAAAPAANARDYPWCVYGGRLGYSGDCSYETREQCLASASGRWNTYCDVNRRARFKRAAPPPNSSQWGR
jgi:hypothetical protein